MKILVSSLLLLILTTGCITVDEYTRFCESKGLEYHDLSGYRNANVYCIDRHHVLYAYKVKSLPNELIEDSG